MSAPALLGAEFVPFIFLSISAGTSGLQEPRGSGRQPPLPQPSAALGIASSQKGKVLMAINSPGWHRFADLCPALSSPILTLLWKCNVSVHCYGRFSLELLIHTSWEEIFLRTSASVQTANHWMRQLPGPGLRLSAGTRPPASASPAASGLVRQLGWGADRPPAPIPPGVGIGMLIQFWGIRRYPQHLTF